MPLDKFLIAPFDQESGQVTNRRPWLIPDKAFQELTNAYVFRDRVRKRFGSRWLGNTQETTRLRINIGVTGAGALDIPGTGIVPPVEPNALAVGQMFSVTDAGVTEYFIVNQLGAGVSTLSTNPFWTGTIDNSVNPNTVTFGGTIPAGLTVYYYPSNPVMGLATLEQININDEITIAFDRFFSYRYVGNGWERIDTGASLWQGSDSQFFWTTTYRGTNPAERAFFVTNFDDTDPRFMRWLDPSTFTWSSFHPQINTAGREMISARILIAFQNHLIAANIWENGGGEGKLHYANRIRWSQFGNPLAADAWHDNVAGKGSGIDAQTTESIISAEFIRNRLILYFERSTYELVYTGNEVQPFTLQLLNTELGAESTFSIVPFDQVVLGIGDVGIHACNGSQVERIDNSIPDTVFQIHNINQGLERVYGIRDYYVEMVYWSYPDVSTDANNPYPYRVLVYNYRTGTWAFNIDTITAFGYFQPQTGVQWSSTQVHWADDVLWGSGAIQARFRNVIAGNQEGWTFIIDTEIPFNRGVLQITNITIGATTATLTVINHNIRADEYIYLEGIISDFSLEDMNNVVFRINNIPDQNTIVVDLLGLSPIGNYLGGGTVAKVSKPVIKTKQFNFYAKEGRNCQFQRAEFLWDKTDDGAMTCNVYISTSSQVNPVISGTGAIVTSPYSTFYGYEDNATRVWRPFYFNAEGEVIQLEFTWTEEQIMDVENIINDFQLHAMLFYTQPTSRLQ